MEYLNDREPHSDSMRHEDLSVLVVANAYPEPSKDYFANQFVSDQVEFLAEKVRKVDVVCPIPLHPKKHIQRDRKDGGVDVHFELYYTPYLLHVHKGDWLEHITTVYFKRILRTIRKEKLHFDIIHAHFTFPSGSAAIRLGKEFDVPVVLTLHENHEWFLDLIRQQDPFYIDTWRSADLVLRVNDLDVELLKNFNPCSYYMPNGFNSHHYYLDGSVVREKNTIFAFGALIERKGYQDLIRAVDVLRRKIPGIKCRIAGKDGGYRRELQQQIESLGLKNNINLLGAVSSDSARKMMNECSVFCHPSISESFGVVQIEAMACGAPVIATMNGASERIVGQDCGLVVERHNLVLALETALMDKQWDNDLISKRVANYDMKVVADRLVGSYLELLNKSAAPLKP